jgi:hypothetical protein
MEHGKGRALVVSVRLEQAKSTPLLRHARSNQPEKAVCADGTTFWCSFAAESIRIQAVDEKMEETGEGKRES